MTTVEKRKKGKKKKNNKKKEAEASSEVLERVMDSIEMAGASLDFFDETPEVTENNSQSADDDVSDETMEAASLESEPVEEVSDEPTDTSDDLELSASEEVTEVAASPAEEDIEDLSAADAEDLAEDSATGEVLEVKDAGDGEGQEAELSEDLSEAETMDMLEDESSSNVEFIEHKQALSILESLLFSSDRPMGIGTFKQVFKGTSYKTKDIKKALEELQTEYADLSRGVTLEEINGGWQLRTKVDNMDYLRKLAKARPFKLSGPALEVLAIIAYKQPIVKSEVDDIRGVESGHLVRALMEKHLVSFQGKSELPGKPMQYGTTRKFLEIFGLRNLRELPSLDEIDQLLPDGIGLEEEDEKLSDVTDKLAEDFVGAYSEGEEELEKIEATLGDIDTSSEFFEEEKKRQKEKRDRDRARDIREALDVGEEVEAKDQRWLERYEAKLAEEAAEAEAAAALVAEKEAGALLSEETAEITEPTDVDAVESLQAESVESPDALIADAESLSEELSDLSSEGLVNDKVMQADADLEAADEEFEALGESSADSTEETEAPTGLEEAQSFDPFDDDEDGSQNH